VTLHYKLEIKDVVAVSGDSFSCNKVFWESQSKKLQRKTVRVYPVKSADFAAFTWKSETEEKLSTYYDFVQAEVETHKMVLKRIGCSESHIQTSSKALKDALESVLVSTTL